MAKVKEGDAVIIASREQTAGDLKSGLYYPHYAGLYGTVLKVYGEEAAVNVDRDALPKEIRVRHEEGEKAMKQKWMDGLSEEARGRAGERDKNFALTYAVLVAVTDIAPDKGAARRAALASSSAAKPATESAKRLSARDIEAAEAAFLAERRSANGDGQDSPSA